MKLFYFPERETDVGVMPSFYDTIERYQEKDAAAMGGRDVSDSDAAWQEYDAQLAAECECTT